MAKFAKAEKAEKQSVGNVLADPEIRKKFKTALALITKEFRLQDDSKERTKETIADISVEYGVDKKLVRKLAAVMYKSNYGDLQEENHHFEVLYETVIEGKLRQPDEIGHLVHRGDPLDAPAEAETVETE